MKISGKGYYWRPKKGAYLAYTKEGNPVLNFTLSEPEKIGKRYEYSYFKCVWFGTSETRELIERIAEGLADKTQIYIEGNMKIKRSDYMGKTLYTNIIYVYKFKIVEDFHAAPDDDANEDEIPL